LTQAVRQASASHALVDGTDVEQESGRARGGGRLSRRWIATRRNAVVAPVGGYVAERSVQLGQHVQAGQALLTVVR